MTDQTSVRLLNLADHFRLVLEVRDAISALGHEDSYLLLRQYKIEAWDSNEYNGPSIGESLQDAEEEKLLGLARYLQIPIPQTVDASPDSGPLTPIDPYNELVAAETALREVVRTTIGGDWIDDFDEAKIEGLESKRREEDKRRDGVTVSQDLLDYTEAYHLESLLMKHWEAVQPILKDKKRTEVHLKLMLSVRNTIAHARPVASFERHLLAGVAGQIQNLLAVHRSSSDGPDAHYASINYVRDSFGEEIKSADEEQLTVPRLQVGQTVSFECSASDPRGREITWMFHLQGNSSAQPGHSLGVAKGAQTRFDWLVSEDDVGEGRYFSVRMGNSSKYHRDHNGDGSVTFRYHVNPPL
ncbi:hypothetical protein [Rhodococcus sp. 1139]|uniref:hypothetical protein n=1 Tax=Rhodococcus sp. 1139 TaxID=1833762 RepID=UPI0008730DDA|nr:hypothetical protein [Rhodococcus sp. 1139]OFE07445.1 hypothetical protein A5N83_18080 [Rhodococcus sp. 1139]